MKISIVTVLILVVFTAANAGCAPQAPATASPVAATSTVAPTVAVEPSPTETAVPTATALPGSVVVPLTTMGKNYPWLPLDKTAVPGVNFFYFNLAKAPFDNVLVRQAFAAAIDREALAAIAQKYGKASAKPATSITPPETLGMDLYNQVGTPFDPAKAKDLLTQAGYADLANFPPVQLLTNAAGDPAPAAHQKMADAMVKMWKTNLGVTVTYEVLPWSSYGSRIGSNPSGIFRLGWTADYNDPHDFLSLFTTGSQFNYGGFSNADFDVLIDRARNSYDPAQRQELYIQAERILCEQEAAVLPIYTATYDLH